MVVSIERLTGGLTPADGSDPRTFPTIWNGAADEIEAVESRVTAVETAVSALPLEIYPVGALYIAVVDTDPSVLFGGTWAAFGQGRVLVGFDGADADFDAAEKTGGAKTHSHTTPSHTHSSASHQHNLPLGWDASFFYYASDSSGVPLYGSDVPFNDRQRIDRGADEDGAWRRARTEATTPGSTGGASPTTNTSSSLQPYITVYMWKRTA